MVTSDEILNKFSVSKALTFFIIFVLIRSSSSYLVPLMVGSEPIHVLCQMGNFGCGDGGWTPVMKINGELVWVSFQFI